MRSFTCRQHGTVDLDDVDVRPIWAVIHEHLEADHQLPSGDVDRGMITTVLDHSIIAPGGKPRPVVKTTADCKSNWPPSGAGARVAGITA